MREIYINLEDVKNFFCKKRSSNQIISKRILGITMRYVRGTKYREMLYFLDYVTPYINENIEWLKKDFKKKSKHKYIAGKTFEQDSIKIERIMNKINPEVFPPATGKFRMMQMYILDFAKEVLNDIDLNLDISIWLDGGSLLGAIRHKGFIPWDDDMDFALLRPDYEKLIKYLTNKYITIDTKDWLIGVSFEEKLNEALKKFPNKIFCFRHIDSFKCVKGTIDKFAILDFFSFDYYNDIHNVDSLQKYFKTIKEETLLAKTYQDVFDIQQREISLQENIVNKSNVINAGVDNFGFYWHSVKENLRETDIFPLKKVKFEDWEFYAPNNHHNYLKSIYNFYNKLPKNGIHLGTHVNTKNLNLED